MASEAALTMPTPIDSPTETSTADKAGVALSVACGVHCLLTPVLLLALPAVGEAFHNPIIHKLIALGVTGIASYALWRGYRRHGHLLPLIIGSVGVIAVWAALAVPHETHDHDHFHLPLGTIITMAGSALLITGHILNIRNCRAGCCHHHGAA
ncbi:MAG TPA: MerC domain-containing protein [Tepidisphaeraceae bacterium]|nr:MerC domain-containing protein [Tepidisphaeraceae bacterium]